MNRSKHQYVRRVAFIGNYLPRQCGIATFTTDLCEAIAAGFEELDCFALPVNDRMEGYAYPPRVRFELAENQLLSYRRAADFLNINEVDVVCLQHEYGIFGGQAGSHILALLRDLRMPLVTTLHTILRDPSLDERWVMEELARLSDRLVVMSERGSEFLQGIYRVPEEKIDLIPHGIPDVPFVDPNFYKDRFGVEGKLVLLTFGLLSPNKGIENVIEALPDILSCYPNIVYIVLGATHPHVRRQQGESYRLSLQRLAQAKGVERHVMFYDRFVSLEELIEFIGAADIYLTPYLNPAQIVSGTLAYAVGAGKAVVSTPYWYAEELLADGRGVLVPFRDAKAIAAEVVSLLDNEAERHAVRKRAYLFSREMTWPKVAARYEESFERAREERARFPRPIFVTKMMNQRPYELPPLNLTHLRRMTDNTGVLQHAIYTVPNYDEGYCTDDNARALVAVTLMAELGEGDDREVKALASSCLAFLWHAFNDEAGRFRNFLSYDRRWLEEVGSEDSHARALWGLGAVVGRSNDRGLRSLAGQLFDQALPATVEFTSPRAWAFALLAIHEYLRRFEGDRAARNVREVLAGRLMDLFRQHSADDWPWFEDIVAYSNAKLPHALLLCGRWMESSEILDVGLKTLRWLMDLQRAEQGHFVPIGSDGFFPQNDNRARFDQQPIEAYAAVSACLEALRITGDKRWREEAERAFEWFLGRNDLGLPLYDPVTGGCHDGLQPTGVNQNQGAESTLAFLLSLLELRLTESIVELEEEVYAQPQIPGAVPAASG